MLLNELQQLNKKGTNYEIAEFIQGMTRALGFLGFEESIPYLIKILKNYYDWLREEAIQALEKINPNWRELYKGELRKNRINL